ncbi:PepSY domain-containing protein [Ciceribacter sp. L1K23]|uniref:PepSY domain-containing protein n=1 Tax=unclassified Ciceribacter TaxID=2628820 RepID=UPI001ABEAFAE|nr:MULTISPECIES: PepSY domain-containing protein [unclassified Ciceribacter]MBO3761206.1 PepSY domain-containing protein [Ciceribacter sp. L1K22]MBR0554719.1 PepSY domain-containing protein [Ciceribacter sp. L1K23]
MKKLIILSLMTLSAAAGIARASENHECNVPKDKWMTEDAMKAKAVELGYDVRQVKVEDGCYEVYGIKDGKKVEAIFNPETGEQIGSEGDD